MVRYSVTIYAVVVLSLIQSGCYFSSGLSTFSAKTSASGNGFLSASERNGQWEMDNPPPKVGEVTEWPIYHYLRKEAAYSLFSSSQDYGLSDPYPRQRYKIAAIREVGTVKENDTTIHYYEIEFDRAENK